MDTHDIAMHDSEARAVARVFWQHVIHPQSDLIVDEETGEVLEEKARLDDKGREILSQIPVEAPLPFEKPEPLHLRIRRLVLDALSAKAQDEGYETMQDFEDFGEDEDFGMVSPYEQEIDNIPIYTDDIRDVGVQQATASGDDTSASVAVSNGDNSNQT